jgi:hypothetical protein
VGEAVFLAVASSVVAEEAPQGVASSSLAYLHLAAAATRDVALLLPDDYNI